MEPMTNDIQTAIQAHLPAAVGEQLRKRLESLAAMETQIESAKQGEVRHRARIAELESLSSRWSKLDEREKSLDARDAALKAKELEYALAAERVKGAGEKVSLVADLARIMFGNKRVWSEQVNESSLRQESSGHSSVSDSRNTTRTVEEE